jgi:pyruvate dehydrogenase E2 component (dihydrolipoamide acetyltransferase)
VDSLLAIIGPAGTDISGIATNFKADKTEESESVSEAKTDKQLQILWHKKKLLMEKNLSITTSKKKLLAIKEFN